MVYWCNPMALGPSAEELNAEQLLSTTRVSPLFVVTQPAIRAALLQWNPVPSNLFCKSYAGASITQGYGYKFTQKKSKDRIG
eukprot:1148072-Pelagomonas_calceolata.AAC.1